MTLAAGILFVTPQGKALFLKRGPGGDHPGEWCFPGGTTEDGETPLQTALREAKEELGSFPDGDRAYWTRRTSLAGNALPGAMPETPDLAAQPSTEEPTTFTTFIQKVDEEFSPELNGEHTGHAWASIDEPPEPLHPGCRVALQRFRMDELGVARAMAAGELTSPQRYENVTLFDIRITGTGQALRNEKKDPKTGKVLRAAEHVWRPPEDYLTEEFLARCNGLPVIWLHPPKSMLNSQEFAKRIIGTTFLPYIKGEEVWAIVKIYEDAAIKDLSDPNKQFSTSPGVSGVGDNKAELEDGSTILVEERPELLDHIAICAVGVWDKGGEPAGVASQAIGDDNMSTEAEEAAAREEAKKRADAATAQSSNIDNMLSKLDSKLDSMSNRLDAMEMDAKSRKDAEEKAEKERKDAEEKAEKEKTDRKDALQKRCDSGEASEEEREELKKLGGEVKDKKKDSEEKEEETMADKKDRKDAAELAATVAAQAQQIAELTRAVAGPTREDEDAMADAQARCDSVAALFAEQAPRPMSGETPLAYRKRLAAPYAKHHPEWANTNIKVLEPSAFAIAEKQIFEAAAQAARNPKDLAPNVLRMVVKRDPETGQVVREFLGDSDACWGRFKPPTRKVAGGRSGFITQNKGH